MPSSKKGFAEASKNSMFSRAVTSAASETSTNSQNFLPGLSSTKQLEGALSVPIHLLQSHPNQIRQNYDQESLTELAEDIKVRGILEPLVVRTVQGGNYQIVAGERRYRAAKLAELENVPVIVRDLDDHAARLTMLIENIQRQDLTASDEKKFFEELQASFNYSMTDIADLIKKSRGYVSKRLNSDYENPTNSDKVHETSRNDELGKNSQSVKEIISTNQEKQSGQKLSSKNTVFKFSLAPIEKLSGNLAAAKEFFQNSEAKPTPEKTQQIKQSLNELKKHIADLEAALSDDNK